MLEEIREGQGNYRLSLPVSVSPEFKGSRMDAWGRDASFQLAALHRVSLCLEEAARILGKTPDPRWKKVGEFLPPYTTLSGPRTLERPEDRRERIALWEGMDLIESHRHHSYLAGIWPFMGIFVHAVDAHTGERIWINSGESIRYQTHPHRSPDLPPKSS